MYYSVNFNNNSNLSIDPDIQARSDAKVWADLEGLPFSPEEKFEKCQEISKLNAIVMQQNHNRAMIALEQAERLKTETLQKVGVLNWVLENYDPSNLKRASISVKAINGIYDAFCRLKYQQEVINEIKPTLFECIERMEGISSWKDFETFLCLHDQVEFVVADDAIDALRSWQKGDSE